MRERIFASIILFFFVLLVTGLFYTQVLKNNLYAELSEKNRIRILPLASPRGKIYDRKGKLLVSNRISFDIEVIFQEIKDEADVIDCLSSILEVDRGKLSRKLEDARKRPFVPVKIVEDVSKDEAIRIEEIRQDLPGVIVTTRPLRNYIYREILSHVIGYLGKISEAELKRFKTYGYRMQDFVGKDGIERTFNDYLRGIDGGLQIEVDSKGRKLRLLAIKEPYPGKDLHLSIDMDLQKFCDAILAGKNGAIVAMDPSSGEVLALVSHPGFDPNIFISSNNFKKVNNLLNDKKTFPMVNRAISGTYQPGSVFKIVVATAALESRNFGDKKTFRCTGSFRVGNRTFHCWKERGHGNLNIVEAIKDSCNVFFYQLGLFVGVDTISKYAFKFGLGRPTGIELPGEASGIVPTPSWKRRKFREPWFKGETANYAIGQGYLLVTPIQIACLASAIANGGKLVQPFIVTKIEDIELHHRQAQDLEIKKDNLDIVREGLRQVVNAPGGTGVYARSKAISISGKTGTAQNPLGPSHAWFVGFAPSGNPKICVVVFIEHGGKGGLNPARFGKKIIEEAKKLELL